MIQRSPRYSREDVQQRGQEIFERKVKPLVEYEDPYRFVAIDVESEDFEVGSDSLETTHRLLAKHPDGQVWMRRVGFPWTYWLGGPPKRGPIRLRKVS